MDKRIALCALGISMLFLACGLLNFESSPLYTRREKQSSPDEKKPHNHHDSFVEQGFTDVLDSTEASEGEPWAEAVEGQQVFDVDTSAANRASRFLWREAVEILAKIPKRSYKEDYLLAYAKLQLGEHRNAREVLAVLSADTSLVIRDYILFDYATALAGCDSVEPAVAVLRQVKLPSLEESAQTKTYELYKQKRDWTRAFAAFDELVKRFPKKYTESGVRLIKAGLYLSSGDTARASELYTSVVQDGTSANILAASHTLDRLGKLNGRNLYLAGKTAANSQNWASADDWLGRYISSGLKADLGDAYYYRARALSRRGRHNDAITIYRKIISDKLYDRAWAELGIAYCSRKLDKFVEAEKHLGAAIAHGEGTNAEAEALWEGVNLGRDQKNYAMVADYATRLSTKFPSHTYGDNGAMWAGLASFTNGNFTEAGARFGMIPMKYSDKTFIEGGSFWSGLSLIAGGDEIGRKLLEDVSRSSTRHYYKYLSTEILTDVALPDPLNARSGSWMSYNEAISLAEIALVERGHRKAMLGATSGAAMRARVFSELGLIERARAEFGIWMNETAMTPALRLTFLSTAYEWGLSGTAYKIALSLVTDMGGYARAPKEVIRLAYPVFYADLIFECAGREGIDPAILFAVARRESMFDPHIVSSAGATGLFQIMPQTGANLSKLLGEYGGYSDSKLYDYNTSARYGSRYLADLLRKHGLAEYALAEYNAGPTPLARWKQMPHEKYRCLFVEGIDFKETRHYVKIVLGDYYAYKELWDGSL